MYEVIAGPFLGDYLLVRPGHPAGLKIPLRNYLELERRAGAADQCPDWLIDPVRNAWGVDLTGRALNDTVLVRARTPYGFGRASYELNLGCNRVGDAGAVALAESPYFAELRELGLYTNRIGTTGARALARSKRLPRLQSLTIFNNEAIDSEATAELHARWGNGIGSCGI